MTIDRSIMAAQGYLELGMFSEALAELKNLPATDQLQQDVLEMRLAIEMTRKDWACALETCATLRATAPDCASGYIQAAFCLHELQQTEQAKKMLLSGPASLLKEPTYYYNLGCYDAVLGNIEEAQHALRISFEMDKKFRKIAKSDPDLKEMLPIL